ncbi:MAG: zinc ribbon domain-containing protein [Archangium sp.]|nr:zinc ribbon domain-containing protein [Archangium sp.]
MPTYAYGCRQCGAELEAKQRITDAPLTRCESCGDESLERKLFATGFVLKGGGWYADGYASKRDSASAHAGAKQV